jgi:hypothetical protein
VTKLIVDLRSFVKAPNIRAAALLRIGLYLVGLSYSKISNFVKYFITSVQFKENARIQKHLLQSGVQINFRLVK